jgi:PIN domain nuclease of toxin-antitoxin system
MSVGKYTIQVPYDSFVTQSLDGNQFTILHIEPRHTAVLTTLPFHHRDPFDRPLTAQAMVEGIPVFSADKEFDAYPVQRIW